MHGGLSFPEKPKETLFRPRLRSKIVLTEFYLPLSYCQVPRIAEVVEINGTLGTRFSEY